MAASLYRSSFSAGSSLLSLDCVSCGGSLMGLFYRGEIAQCSHCKRSFRVPVTMTPEPDLGDLILGADFSEPIQLGWARSKEMTFEPGGGDPPRLAVREPTQPSSVIRSAIWTPAHFDDFDLSCSFRLDQGTDDCSIGFRFRQSTEGGYGVRISPRGTFSVCFQKPGYAWGGWIITWAEHNAVCQGFGVTNRLRVVCNLDRIRVYINGVLATSLRDTQFRSGKAEVVVNGDKSDLLFSLADLQLREPPLR